MSEEIIKKEEVVAVAETKRTGRPEFRKNRRPSRPRRDSIKPEFDHRILNMRRVARVTAGGKRFNFSVAVIVGNRNGKVGVGTGKANDTSLAIEKAIRRAKKNVVEIKLTKEKSIPHDVTSKYSSARVILIPAHGRGVIAGSALRDCIELTGITGINGKILSGSKNKLNIAQATVKALSSLKAPKN